MGKFLSISCGKYFDLSICGSEFGKIWLHPVIVHTDIIMNNCCNMQYTRMGVMHVSRVPGAGDAGAK